MSESGKNLREQLVPLREKLRATHAVIRPVSQVTIRLKPRDSRDSFATTVDNVLPWLKNRAGRELPESAWAQQSFELTDVGAQRAAAIAMDDPKYWTARLDDADQFVPLRTWVTEVGVAVDGSGDVLFGARLICATRGEDVPFDRTIPGFVRGIVAKELATLDGEALESKARVVATDKEVDWLVSLLEKPDREADVIVFSLPEGSINELYTAIPVKGLYEQTVGATHVIVLTAPASYLLTDRVGKELSVFRQAVRTYKPLFRSWVDEPARHPLALPDRIANFANGGAAAFEKWLINQSLANTVHIAGREQRLPSFNTVRQISAQLERDKRKEAGATDSDMLVLYHADNNHLRNELKEQKDQYDGLLVSADQERKIAIEEAGTAKRQTFNLRLRIRALEEQATRISGETRKPVPNDLADFEKWCVVELGGSIEIVNRAYQGVRKSEFEEISLIYRSLLALRNYYVPMRRERDEKKKFAYEKELAELQLEESLTGDGVKFDPDLYSVTYNGIRKVLDRHLKRGNSRDPRFCFRLYFFWDDEAEIVVVGWLPTHLDNRMT